MKQIVSINRNKHEKTDSINGNKREIDRFN